MVFANLSQANFNALEKKEHKEQFQKAVEILHGWDEKKEEKIKKVSLQNNLAT